MINEQSHDSLERSSVFPNLTIDGPPVNPKGCVESGTGRAVFLASLGGGLIIVGLTLITYGLALAVMLIAAIIESIRQGRIRAAIRGSGIQISERQFPEIDQCVQTFAQRLGLDHPPEVFIIESEMLNANAVRVGRKSMILLTDEIVYGALMTGQPQVLSFILGHEMGHIALNHMGTWRTWIKQINPRISRLDEFTVDRIAMKLVGKRGVAFQGVLMLTIGPHLLPFLNIPALKDQIEQVENDRNSAKSEKTLRLSHPLLIRRLARILND
jgi:Zn-dependent protease with chaperone function